MMESDVPQNFEKLNLIGTGSFGSVFLVKCIKTDALYAMKVVPKQYSQHFNSKINTEYDIMTHISHPYVLKMYFHLQDEKFIYMFTDYCPCGDFYNYLRGQKQNCITEPRAIYYTCCIITALEYLHSNNIVHRDLKPENILLKSNDEHIILTDFDLSFQDKSVPPRPKIFQKPYSHEVGSVIEPNCIMYDKVGTAEYLAPEIVKNKPYTCVVD